MVDKVLGLEPVLRDAGYSFDTIDLYTEGAGRVFDKVRGFHSDNGGTRAISIGRPVLHDAFLDGCKGYGDLINVKFGAKVVKIEGSVDDVTAVLEDGSRLRGMWICSAIVAGCPLMRLCFSRRHYDRRRRDRLYGQKTHPR